MFNVHSWICRNWTSQILHYSIYENFLRFCRRNAVTDLLRTHGLYTNTSGLLADRSQRWRRPSPLSKLRMGPGNYSQISQFVMGKWAVHCYCHRLCFRGGCPNKEPRIMITLVTSHWKLTKGVLVVCYRISPKTDRQILNRWTSIRIPFYIVCWNNQFTCKITNLGFHENYSVIHINIQLHKIKTL